MEIDNQLETITSINSNTISFGNNGSVILPIGSTLQRPLFPVEGMTRMNSDLGLMEIFQQGSWRLQVTLPETSLAALTSITNILGGNPNSGFCMCLDKSVDDFIINTQGPTDLFTYIIPGGTLNPDSILKLEMGGFSERASGSSRKTLISIIFGGTVIYSASTKSDTHESIRAWKLDYKLINFNDLALQKHNGMFMQSKRYKPEHGKAGKIDEKGHKSVAVFTGYDSAVDTSVDQPLTITISSDGSNIIWTKTFHILELV